MHKLNVYIYVIQPKDPYFPHAHFIRLLTRF